MVIITIDPPPSSFCRSPVPCRRRGGYRSCSDNFFWLDADVCRCHRRHPIVLKHESRSSPGGGIGPSAIFSGADIAGQVIITIDPPHRPQSESRFLAGTGGIGPGAIIFLDADVLTGRCHRADRRGDHHH